MGIIVFFWGAVQVKKDTINIQCYGIYYSKQYIFDKILGLYRNVGSYSS